MKKKIPKIVVLLFLTSTICSATIVDVSVATDKSTYQLGEEVAISVTAYNPNTEAVTLTCGFYETSYIMDGVYDWAEGRSGPAVIIYVTIEPDDFVTWELNHGTNEMQEYPLSVGIHSLVGEVLAGELLDIGQSKSSPIEFEVVPEPVSILLLGMGVIGIRVNRHKTYNQC